MSSTHNEHATGEIHALLGKGTEFQGTLTFEGRVRIDGKFVGEIFSSDVLVLGESAEVEASIEIGTLVMNGGTLRGNVRASTMVEARSPAKIIGNIEAPQLFIDKGVIFEGQCVMTRATPPEATSVDEAPSQGATPSTPEVTTSTAAVDGPAGPSDV